MARPIKKGLDYFPLDVDFFEDKKIRALKGKYGLDGVMVYLYAICQIYKEGYYAYLDEDFILCMSDDLSITEYSTRQILKYLFSRSLLCEIKDSTLAKPVTIITAASIQRRFQEAKKGAKRDVVVEAKYWILKKSETLSFIKVYPNENKSEKNPDKSEKNPDKSEKNPTKKSKEKKRKVKYMSSDGKIALENLSQEQYRQLCGMSSASVVDKYISKIVNWQSRSGRLCTQPYETIKSWIEKDGKFSEPKNTSYDLDQWEHWAMNYGLNEEMSKNDEL